jgi:hypothetical protein
MLASTSEERMALLSREDPKNPWMPLFSLHIHVRIGELMVMPV